MAEQADQLIDLPAIAEGETDSAAREVYNNVKVSLADLCAKATSNYARKNYNAAVDYYARASELQAELNGEMDPDNAEILFLYGRSLFKVGQSKSDVLGGRAGGEKKKPNGAAKSKSAKKEEPSTDADKVAEEGVALIAEGNGIEKEDEDVDAKKPLFQFTGDENFEDSDDEDGGEEEDEDEDEDDLAAAFEVLDLARVLFVRKLDQPGEGAEKEKEVGDSQITKHMKERLAETHDILAEISLENERFPSAVSDFRQSLEYKQKLYPFESEVIAEAHYKLSLALEFASITTTGDDDAEADGEGEAEAEAKKDEKGDSKDTQIDEAMREEAAKELEQAIASTKLKLQNKEVDLASTLSVDDNDITIAQIAEVKEVVAEMEQRLLDLRADPVDMNAALNGASGLLGNVNPLGGILGNTLGESPAETQARIEEAKKTATDLSGLVRRKKEKASNEDSNDTDAAKAPVSNGKRKAENIEEDEATDSSTKKAKVEDAVDAEA